MNVSKLFFLWLTILMLLPTACLAENNAADSFPSAEELAQNWNANYGLYENYFDLQDTYGPIAFWSVERQYWFASIIRELCVLEQERLIPITPAMAFRQILLFHFSCIDMDCRMKRI